ncbi:MAG: FGGY family carbohydrate kinase [Saprospiraceae bacterium]
MRPDFMYFLGFDLGSSFIKASILDADNQQCIAQATIPDQEMKMVAYEPGWAEQDPDQWWMDIKLLTQKIIAKSGIDGDSIAGIGISYQMHGLVIIDKTGKVLRPSIIWCDSRAVHIGDQAFQSLGSNYCLTHLLNSPGNFTASKLRWVIENEPDIAARIYAFMLPGDFINYRFTGEMNTTISSLSEGIFWDFKNNEVSVKLLENYHISPTWTPEILPSFSIQGRVTKKIADELGLKAGTPVSYRAGDQPNNAFSLNVNQPGEIAATAGTSGVVYAVHDSLMTDPFSRVNAFAHINHEPDSIRIGTLLCINGTGIANSWLKRLLSQSGVTSYDQMNQLASQVQIGSDNLQFMPFGNGAERMLGNKMVGSHLHGLNFNIHGAGHLARSIQEGIVFAFKYGTDILSEHGFRPKTIKAGKSNMFLSPVFRQLFSSLIDIPLEFFDTDGATGAARGAGIGQGHYTLDNAFDSLKKIETIFPDPAINKDLTEIYSIWKRQLEITIKDLPT